MAVEEGSSDAIIDEVAALRRKLTGLEREYNYTRQELFNKTRRYYNQSIASNFIREDNLRELISKCEEIKKLYSDVQSEYMSKRPNKKWSFNESFKFDSQYDRKEK